MSTTDDLPREPGAWSPGVHFGQRFREPGRRLDGEIVAHLIREGDTRDQGDRIYLEDTIGGVHFRLVVGADDRTVVTGYPLGIDETQATASPRWTPRDLDAIREWLD